MDKITMKDSFWNNYLQLVKEEVIPYQWEALNDRIPNTEPSRAIKNFKIAAGEAEGKFYGMVFQDSDVAKWLEAVAYSLEHFPDQKLEETADELINLLEKAQLDDGYLNTYYTVAEPNNRWTNVRDNHELYCAGHLIEAAVTYYRVTGKDKFLNVMCKYADYIVDTFGEEDSKIHGYPGHQEIELALVKLYDVTGIEKYLNLSKYFIDERGRQPHYFDIEKEARNDKNAFFYPKEYEYHQAHQPVRGQEKAVGHSVRAIYMYSAMADLALKTNDESLIEASKRLWNNVTSQQMYITGGVGSEEFGESFSFDYDLPNDISYTETCASIALVFWAKRMLDLHVNRKYADVMEKALYNGTISGMSLDGKSFFYVNPLEVFPKATERHSHHHVKPVRQKWFNCACCPPNLARLISSIHHYIYSKREDQLFIHLYCGNESSIEVNNQIVDIEQKTDYPWDGKVSVFINPTYQSEFTIALRLPGWCDNPFLNVNGEEMDIQSIEQGGYVYINRTWKKGDSIELLLPMSVKQMKAHPLVRQNIGKVALQRGPIIYCLEEIDNGENLQQIFVDTNKNYLDAEFDSELLGGVVKLFGTAYRLDSSLWKEDCLYAESKMNLTPIEVKAIPYYSWCNRKPGEMLVWINEK
ncbi:hypothetical protein MACH08_12190 [Oceanobacillus kimchii]|uniref:Glycoside hydrolase family 127 protein n=2 Tax=Oceanobacillus kimchii TaxID=746691 RepID=A0ABQ5TG46_9BACI|nr:hypothetical protein MACH08_12190 [Oceanobacillus kimchii]